MRILDRKLGLWFVLAITLLGCASPTPASPPAGSGPAAQNPAPAPARTGPKRLVAAIQGSPLSGYAKLDATNSERGNQELGVLVHQGLTATDLSGQLVPRLAEAVPTIENGNWKLNSDGTMETTWKLRPGAEWHDGTPLTTDDLVFTMQVVRDREGELARFRERAYTFIDSIQAVDKQTVTVKWKQPFIEADRLFSDRVGPPLPKHLLEAAYQEDKATLLQLPYWNANFVGLGPFKVKDWQRGTQIIVQANDRFIMGRPKIDEIELKTIPDANTIMANLLGESADLLLGRSLSLDQIVELRQRMPSMQIQTPLTSLLVLNPQLLEPDPAIILNVNFRKAMMHAINRDEMAETIDYGLVPVAHGPSNPTMREGQEIESSLVKYDFDPRKSAQLIEALGYTKGSDGFYRDPSGQTLKIEIRTTQSEINPKTMFAASDYLKRAGIEINPVIIPLQLVNDQVYRSAFPGMIVNGGGQGEDPLGAFHSREARTPENNYAGSNRSRYMNPEMDALVDRYLTTIAFGPRMDVARQIGRHVTENLPILPLIFDTWPSAASGKIVNVGASQNGGYAPWNAHEWDLK
jgi:peptide/nickel transport system substrate-binding protein